MTRYLLDTNMMQDFIERRRGMDVPVRSARTRGAVIGTCMPVLAELFFGVERSATREINRLRLVRGLNRIQRFDTELEASGFEVDPSRFRPEGAATNQPRALPRGTCRLPKSQP